MKAKHLFLTALFLLAGCNLIWSPTATVKKFMTAAQKGDTETMTQLFSGQAISRDGIEKIKETNELFAKLTQTANTGVKYQIININEGIDDNKARVAFDYQLADKTHSTHFVFGLSNEGGAWKIDSIGGSELDETKASLPTTTVPMLTEEAPPTPPPAGTTVEPETKTTLAGKPISGGMLNDKAISLPKPPYPPVARAAKASGTVVIQVLVDENGNVVEARAVSGHPLLQAAAAAAARNAKFSPTRLSGQPVKVSGVLTYQFVAE
ncbi:MAG TPA: energy transducer TonB [Pyrinomonadaceae bacterium]|jgi:TonB family protein|nr:energy transducer TonB [Pyrinomonadaceae bacterium]